MCSVQKKKLRKKAKTSTKHRDIIICNKISTNSPGGGQEIAVLHFTDNK